MGLPLLAVSGEEIVLALQRAGFRAVRREEGSAVLSHGYRDVTVPDGRVDPAQMLSILRAAGVPYADFLELLEESPGLVPQTSVRRRTLPERK